MFGKIYNVYEQVVGSVLVAGVAIGYGYSVYCLAFGVA
jgi:hypothetical protein